MTMTFRPSSIHVLCYILIVRLFIIDLGSKISSSIIFNKVTETPGINRHFLDSIIEF